MQNPIQQQPPQKRQLLDLPAELLNCLITHLHDIGDFTNVAASCRALRTACNTATPNDIFGFVANSESPSFRPQPQFLVLACARRLSAWAHESSANAEAFDIALQSGIGSLALLAWSSVGLRLSELRKWQAARFSIINPLCQRIKEIVAEEISTTTLEPELAAFQVLIYNELFAADMQAVLDPAAGLPRHSIATRLNYIKYSIPDWYRQGLSEGQTALNDLQSLLRGGRWSAQWTVLCEQVGPAFTEEWKQKLWIAATQLETANVEICLRGTVTAEERVTLEKNREFIEKLNFQSRPQVETGEHGNDVSTAPCMADDVYYCLFGDWWYY